jgi:hypothetical protein
MSPYEPKALGGDIAAHKEFDMSAEFAGLDFHSIRLEERFIRTMETLIKQPDKSIWEASENRAEASIRRMSDYGGTILAVQDTTGINYNTI